MIKQDDVSSFYRYTFPMQAVLVTCKDDDNKTNIITIAWHTTLSKQPPLYGISVAPSRYSHDLIKNSKEFVINFMSYPHAEAVHYCGSHSGRNNDKINNIPVTFTPSKHLSTPGITQAHARLECTLHDTVTVGDHSLFVGKVIHLDIQPEAYENQLLHIQKLQPLFYLGKNTYTNGKDQQSF